MGKQSDAAQTNKHQAAQLLFIGGMVLDENLKEELLFMILCDDLNHMTCFRKKF